MSQTELNVKKFTAIAVQGLVISIAVSSLVLLFTSSGDTLSIVREEINWKRVPLLAVPVFISWSCNGLRFWLMSRCIGRPLKYTRAVSIAVSSEFGVMASPGGIGGAAVRLGFLKKSGIPYAHGAALLAADIFLDILFFISITPFALTALFNYIPFDAAAFANGRNCGWLALLLMPVLFCLLRKPVYQALKRQKHFRRYRVDGRLRLARQKLTSGFRKGRNAFRLIFKEHRGMLLINYLLAGLQFSARYSILPLAIFLLGYPVNPLPLIVMQGLLFMISMLAVAPGGGGSVEVLAALALPQLMPTDLVGVAILLWRVFTYHFYLLFGGLIFARTLRKPAPEPYS